MLTKHMTKEDVDKIIDNLWPRGQEEILIMGSTIEKTRAKFKAMVGRPWSTAFYRGEECFALIIMEPVGEMTWRTQFAATSDGFKENWLSLTKFLRKVSDKIVNEYSQGRGIIELETTGDSDYNWFQSLGFELIGTDGFIDKYVKKAV